MRPNEKTIDAHADPASSAVPERPRRVVPVEPDRTIPKPVVHSRSGGTFASGQLVDDRFTIIEKVGLGGWGEVYRAMQHSTKREVALKILRKDVAEASGARERFVLEAQAVSKLTHQNTVTLFDFGQTKDGVLYMAMEFLEGESLDQVIRREGRISGDRCLHIIRQVALSLDEAHGKGIVHRDIKPHNIMLMQRPGEADFVKVLDFGVAKMLMLDESLTVTGTTFGTPEYMSPEQIHSKHVDHRSDIYSLGIIMFTMLKGNPPFSADSPIGVALNHVSTPLPQLPKDLHVAKPVEDLLRRMASKKPDDRPMSSAEVAQEIEQILQRGGGTPGGLTRTLAMPTSISDAGVKLWPFLLVLFGIIAAGTAGFLIVNGGQEPKSKVPEVPALVAPAPEPVAPAEPVAAPEPSPEPAAVPQPVAAPAPTVAPVAAAQPAPAPAPEPEVAPQPAPAPPAPAVEAAVAPEAPAEEAAPAGQEAEAAPQTEASIAVVASIRGAKVLLDGEFMCHSPCLLERPAGQNATLKIQAEGYSPLTQQVLFAEGRQKLELKLAPVPLSARDELKGSARHSVSDDLK